MHTVHTMKNLVNLRVHIAPVGFEIDRVVLPAKQMKADKVWLLGHENVAVDKARPYIEKISKQLQKENIQVIIEYHDRLDLFKIIKSVKQIIEKESGNDIFVNLASGSKIQAIACMMACMMFNESKNVIPFYAQAREHFGFKGQISRGIKNLVEIPSYEIQKPEEKHIRALEIIRDHGGKLTKKEMAKLCDDAELITVRAEKGNYSQARFASLDKNIIQPLIEKWGFIEVDKVGRNRWIKITEDGNNAAKFLI